MNQLLNVKNLRTFPCPRTFPSPTIHPLRQTPRPTLPPTLFPWVRQVTITYHELNVNSRSTDRWSKILSYCYNSANASRVKTESVAFFVCVQSISAITPHKKRRLYSNLLIQATKCSCLSEVITSRK